MRRLSNDLQQFPEVQVGPARQDRFIGLWHRHPNMTMVELARRSKLSRPTCYKLVKLLQARGDVRGEVIDGAPVAGHVLVSKVGRVRDLSHYRRVDLLRELTLHEDYVNTSFALLCKGDSALKRHRNDAGEIDLQALIDTIKGRLRYAPR